jgi:hypothetical protein
MITDETESTTEVRYVALQLWWERHGAKFCNWFSTLSTTQRESILRDASPDMPRQPPANREKSGLRLSATDVILPELTLDGLLGQDGKLLFLFMTRRCLSADRCFQADVKLLTTIFKRGGLPVFSGEQLKNMDTPFVDPVDPEENVRALGPSTPKEGRDMINGHLETGRLIHAEVWLSLQVRRYSLVNFMVSLILTFEKANHLLPREEKDTDTRSTETSTTGGTTAIAATYESEVQKPSSSDIPPQRNSESDVPAPSATVAPAPAPQAHDNDDEEEEVSGVGTEGVQATLAALALGTKLSVDKTGNASSTPTVKWVEISPTFEALLRSELEQIEAVEAMAKVEEEKEKKVELGRLKGLK